MKAANANSNLLANRRAFSFLLRIQKGLNLDEKTLAFENIFGDPRNGILKSADIKGIITAGCLEFSQQHLVNLSFLTTKFDAVYKSDQIPRIW